MRRKTARIFALHLGSGAQFEKTKPDGGKRGGKVGQTGMSAVAVEIYQADRNVCPTVVRNLDQPATKLPSGPWKSLWPQRRIGGRNTLMRMGASEIESGGRGACEAVRCRALGNLGSFIASTIRSPFVWVPALLLLALTAIFRTTDADVTLVRPFFDPDGLGGTLADRWPLMNAQPWRTLYDWGVYPALILGFGGLAVWIVSFFWARLERWRDPGLFFALVLIVGPLIIVNIVCKPYWSRPRPHATIPYGGDREFVPVWDRGVGQEDSSFPSGHAAMGFYLMAPAFVCYRRRPRLALALLLVGLGCGGVIGLARIVAGSHFPSDVLWSGGFLYFTALVIAAPFRFGRDEVAAALP